MFDIYRVFSLKEFTCITWLQETCQNICPRMTRITMCFRPPGTDVREQYNILNEIRISYRTYFSYH